MIDVHRMKSVKQVLYVIHLVNFSDMDCKWTGDFFWIKPFFCHRFSFYNFLIYVDFFRKKCLGYCQLRVSTLTIYDRKHHLQRLSTYRCKSFMNPIGNLQILQLTMHPAIATFKCFFLFPPQRAAIFPTFFFCFIMLKALIVMKNSN